MKKETTLLAQDTARTVDENGFLHVSFSHITKACVNPYRGNEIPSWQENGLDPDRIYYALRDPEELIKSLGTWKGLPLQFEHHDEGAQDPEAKETRVGTVGTEIKWNAPYIDAPLTVWSQDAIDAIKDGTCRELSCSYRYDPDFTAGTYQGEPYDFVMRNIRGNHVALVPEGRAGHDVLVADKQLSNLNPNPNQRGSTSMDDPKTEAREVQIGEVIEKAGQELQNLHAPDAQGNLQDKPAPETQDEGNMTEDGLEEIKAKYNLDDDALAEIKAVLQGATDTDENVEATDEDETEAVDGEEDETTADEEDKQDKQDAIVDSMEKCGLDADNEEVRNAFLKGIAFNQGEKDKAAEEVKEEAQKAADRAMKNYESRINAKYKAAAKVAPLVGKVDPLTYDSAASIYAYALKKQGVSLAGYTAKDYPALLQGFLAAKAPKVRKFATAQDSAKRFSFANRLNSIRIEE